jgi:hypothetical protein
MVTMPTQRAIGSGPSKDICSQNARQNTDARSIIHLFAGEDAGGYQKLTSQKSAEIRPHPDALQTILYSLNFS